MRFTDELLTGIKYAKQRIYDFMPIEDPSVPEWQEIKTVDLSDFPLYSVRFHGRCVDPKVNNLPVAGTFTCLLDAEGNFIAAYHSAAGLLDLDPNPLRGAVKVMPGQIA